jgi:signal transduction histidine kinase
MSFTAPEKVCFKHKLSGFDEDWIMDGTVRSATYSRLPPGRYEFQVTACNNDGLWNQTPASCEFLVKPALWQTAWFRGSALFLFAVLVAGMARYFSTVRMRRQLLRLEQANALERERTRIARDLHDDLGARLTQMAFLTDLAAAEPIAPVEVKTQLQEVSNLARVAVRSLDETVWMVNPQKDSLPHLVEYLGNYAEDFFRGTSVRCWQQICASPPEGSLPGDLRKNVFLSVKEAFNNVLKHAEATEVWLRISVRGRVLRIAIVDKGRGFDSRHSARRRNGLDNMCRRMEAAGGWCRLRSVPGRGTWVVLRVKLPTEFPLVQAGK